MQSMRSCLIRFDLKANRDGKAKYMLGVSLTATLAPVDAQQPSVTGKTVLERLSGDSAAGQLSLEVVPVVCADGVVLCGKQIVCLYCLLRLALFCVDFGEQIQSMARSDIA